MVLNQISAAAFENTLFESSVIKNPHPSKMWDKKEKEAKHRKDIWFISAYPLKSIKESIITI